MWKILIIISVNVGWYSMKEAEKKVKPGAEIIYMGWIMAGKIKGYPEAARKYNIKAVCGVGMGQTGTQLTEVRAKNKIPQRIPLFTLQGTFDIRKLHGVYKMMMNVMVKTAGKHWRINPTGHPRMMICWI